LTLCLRTWFERISIGVILLNCVTLGMFQPRTYRAKTAEPIEEVQFGVWIRVGPRNHAQLLL